MTTCNFCKLRNIKARAKAQDMKVTCIKSGGELRGTDVFVHPKDVKIVPSSTISDNSQHEEYFVAWLMSIPSQCEC